MPALPVVFQEETSLGIKVNSSCKITLERKLTPGDKAELLEYAKGNSKLYVGRRQVGDLYELKENDYTLLIDSSGKKDKIHIRTNNGPSTIIGLFGSLLLAALSFFMTVDYPVTWRSFGIPLILFGISTLYYILAQKYFKGSIKYQELKILKMIQKIDLVQSDKDLSSDH